MPTKFRPEDARPAGPYITMQRAHGTVTVTAHNKGGYVVIATGKIERVEAAATHGEATALAHKLAAELD
jgi:hypothetical protein